MSVPSKHIRYVTAEAEKSLSERLNIPIRPFSQDWTIEIATGDRLDEFLQALLEWELTDDERFALGVIVMESFNNTYRDGNVTSDPRWLKFVSVLDSNPILHASTLYDYACLDCEFEDCHPIAKSVRLILQKHLSALDGKQ